MGKLSGRFIFLTGCILTTKEITPIMTIPNVSSKWPLDTLASVCPPTIQLRIKNPCMEKTVNGLGMIDP